MQKINKSGVTPTGGHILVIPDPVKEVTKGGIFIPETIREKEQQAATSGILVAIGDTAWTDLDNGAAWAKIGDHVSYGRYAGITITGKDGVNYTLLNDNDLLAVLSF